MQFEFTEPQTELERLMGGYYCINAFGNIDGGDDEKFIEFLDKLRAPRRLTVYINSLGGDVDTAISIGRLIRKNWFSTSVGSYSLHSDPDRQYVVPRVLNSGNCVSAATLVFLGGRLRNLPNGSKFGVHQFSFKNPTPTDISRSQVLSAKIAQFIHEMGVSPIFLEISSATRSDQITYLDDEMLRSMKVVTDWITDAVWTVLAANQIMYVRGERDSLFGHHKVMLCYAKGVGFAFWAVIESQGRESELTGFKTVEIVLNGEESRIDISGRCERQVFGLYTNVVARISEDEARRIAFSESFGVQIRFSREAPLFLGVAAMSTDGGKDQLQTFFNSFSEN